MDYWHELTIPASTAVTSPYREVMLLSAGTIEEIMVFFPKGQRGYVHCRILHQEHQQWPSTPDSWYLGDGTVIEFPEAFELNAMPYQVALEGYNEDPDYDHTVYVRITVSVPLSLVPPMPPTTLTESPLL